MIKKGNMLVNSPKYPAELRGPKAQPENAYGESERLGLASQMVNKYVK